MPPSAIAPANRPPLAIQKSRPVAADLVGEEEWGEIEALDGRKHRQLLRFIWKHPWAVAGIRVASEMYVWGRLLYTSWLRDFAARTITVMAPVDQRYCHYGHIELDNVTALMIIGL